MTTHTAQERALLALARSLDERGYHFITPTPLTHARVNERPENRMAEDLAGVFGWNRPFHADLLPPALGKMVSGYLAQFAAQASQLRAVGIAFLVLLVNGTVLQLGRDLRAGSGPRRIAASATPAVLAAAIERRKPRNNSA